MSKHEKSKGPSFLGLLKQSLNRGRSSSCCVRQSYRKTWLALLSPHQCIINPHGSSRAVTNWSFFLFRPRSSAERRPTDKQTEKSFPKHMLVVGCTFRELAFSLKQIITFFCSSKNYLFISFNCYCRDWQKQKTARKLLENYFKTAQKTDLKRNCSKIARKLLLNYF